MIGKILGGFVYAFRGIFECMESERNMRIHIVAAVTVFALAVLCELSKTEFAVLFLTVGAVISLEAVNTAVESAVDLTTEKIHPLAERAKDCSAGAVLVMALFSVCVGVCIFGDAERLRIIADFITSDPVRMIGTVCYVFLCTAFVFMIPYKSKNDKNIKK